MPRLLGVREHLTLHSGDGVPLVPPRRRNDTDELSDREAARVEKRLNEKAKKEAQIKALLEAGL